MREKIAYLKKEIQILRDAMNLSKETGEKVKAVEGANFKYETEEDNEKENQ